MEGLEGWAAVLEAANSELRARFTEAGWVSLSAAARQANVSKGSMHAAIRRGQLRSVRLLPDGRAAVLVLVHPGDLAAYLPREYPRRNPLVRNDSAI